MAAGDIVSPFAQVMQSMWANLVQQFTEFFPDFVWAIVLVVLGFLIGIVAKRIVTAVLKSTKVDSWIDEQNLAAALGGKEVSVLAGSLTKWYIIGVFLAQAVGLLPLETFKSFLETLFVKGPNGTMPVFFAILAASIIMVVGLLIARYIRNWIEASTYKMKKMLGLTVEAIVLIFAGIMALTLIFGREVTSIIIDLLQIFVTPFIWAFAVVLAIVVGISLLVNSREELQKISQELRKAVK